MHTDAITSQAALTGSPRRSATMANEIVPTTIKATHKSLFQMLDLVSLSLLFIIFLQTCLRLSPRLTLTQRA